jgi:hypothetical protein
MYGAPLPPELVQLIDQTRPTLTPADTQRLRRFEMTWSEGCVLKLPPEESVRRGKLMLRKLKRKQRHHRQ